MRPVPLWVWATLALFAAVSGAALWQGWSHRNGGPHGPEPIRLSDVIRARGLAPGSVPP